MLTSKIYVGIGSRKTPPDELAIMTDLATALSDFGWLLRSGGAIGADRAFEAGASKKEIFLAKDSTLWAEEYVNNYCMPKDRANFKSMKPYIRSLLSRNMMQVLGKTGSEPASFVVCWTPSEDYSNSSSGGTGYAIRCALKNGIPVFNLFNKDVKLQVLAALKGYYSQ